MLTTIASPFINPLAAWLALYPLDSREARLATEGPTSCCCSRWSIVIRSIFAISAGKSVFLRLAHRARTGAQKLINSEIGGAQIKLCKKNRDYVLVLLFFTHGSPMTLQQLHLPTHVYMYMYARSPAGGTKVFVRRNSGFLTYFGLTLFDMQADGGGDGQYYSPSTHAIL